MEFIKNMVDYLQEINYASIILRIALAVLFGGLIGFERGRHGSQAGMRTHILVCLGGMLTALVGVYCNQVLGYANDPLRIAAQVVSGIGFLGAGMIIVKSDKMITGLTTAAIMWTTAIIGISLGIGFYSGAFFAMLACLFTAAFLTRVERKRKKTARIYIEVSDLPSLGKITDEVKTLLPEDCHIEIISPKSGMSGHLGIYVITTSLKDIETFRKTVESMSGIYFVIFE